MYQRFLQMPPRHSYDRPPYLLLQAAARSTLPHAAARLVMELYGRAMDNWQPLDYRELAQTLGSITPDTVRRAITLLIEAHLVDVRHLGHGRKEARLRHPQEEE